MSLSKNRKILDWGLQKITKTDIKSKNLNSSTTEIHCPAGEELIGTTCTVCQSGFYKSQAGNEMCQECPSNTESVPGRTSCRKFYLDLLTLFFSLSFWYWSFSFVAHAWLPLNSFCYFGKFLSFLKFPQKIVKEKLCFWQPLQDIVIATILGGKNSVQGPLWQKLLFVGLKSMYPSIP